MYPIDPRPALLKWLALAGLVLAFTLATAHAQQNGNYGNITTAGTDCTVATRCVSYHFQKPDYGSATLQLTGTFSGTVQFEISNDNGATWNAIQGFPEATGAGVTSSTGTGVWQFEVGGFTDIRARCSAYTSGTISVVIAASLASADLPNSVLPGGNAAVEIVPDSTTTIGITRIVSAAAESNHVLKGSAGNLYGVYVTTGATAGYLLVFNATSAPVDGAVTPSECLWAPANSTTFLNFNPGPPAIFSTGITAVFSSTGCFTKTASATAYFAGSVK